jgi:hypothetical protein
VLEDLEAKNGSRLMLKRCNEAIFIIPMNLFCLRATYDGKKIYNFFETENGHGDKEAWVPPPSPPEGLTFFFLR